MNYTRRLLDNLSVEQVKIELLNTAYGNGDTFIAKLDPRTLFIWYLFFGFVPWFIHDPAILGAFFSLMVVMTIMTKVSPLIIVILCLGLLSQAGYLLIASWFFGGNLDTILPLLILTLKLSTISLASIVVFSSMDPEKLSDGLLSIGVPSQVSFSIAYGYRMLPSLVEEFHQIFLSFRLRGKAPEKKGLLYWRMVVYLIKIAVLSFYPLILSSAKRARTTVEALESKGYSSALTSPDVKKIKLQHMRFRFHDLAFLSLSGCYIVAAFLVTSFY
ncbi:energy-coupling factor transporter transmembrane protein EcfT [Salipaludibacillus agaradhaerens]|uniref:Energy-coupling factor transporter transmembrane protein EcfT n=1 Tax=Salipaludibacillus agaradhaerens TaxID=76935 RepID=A0A9Q4FYC6_SALAG|nr:energy-coupling factor transporter transmembrane component T [Salipaludibacillus agaradhaerens]MCR6096226.1 energy-coupling factor transporter transmembrane protein EcfT [Salipaludibacillus agaradhaerens]MCR6114215.1 energy-coupling factor transporter transmembrane protein EcfT [Salipaludibacillus agaradhaerens]